MNQFPVMPLGYEPPTPEDKYHWAVKYFSDRDNVDLELTAPQITYILKHIDNEKTCYHMHVEIHSRLAARETHYQPAEYDQKAYCDDCGEWLEVEDVPEVATRVEA